MHGNPFSAMAMTHKRVCLKTQQDMSQFSVRAVHEQHVILSMITCCTCTLPFHAPDNMMLLRSLSLPRS